MENENTYTEAECMLLLQKILREYPEFLNAYMPNGWRNSECVKFFHPTAEQQFEEDKIITKNLKRWSKSEIEEKENLLSDFEQDLSYVNENKESQTLLGLCLWDIFSNNHSAKDANGKEYDLGSFRGSAAVITELINGVRKKNRLLNFDYAEFYMGTIWIDSRANLQPFYEYIFSFLKDEGCDWTYSFPRMGLINFNNEETPQPENYNPEKAMQQEIENKKADELQKKIDSIYEEKYEDAKYKMPSALVIAYQKIYGQLPDGHPQKNL